MRIRWLMIVLIALTVAACRQQPEPASPDAEAVEVTLDIAPMPNQVGEATAVVTLADGDGTPITDAAVELRGDMNMTGMQPVIREASGGIDGEYSAPWEWTMGGDWFVIVEATLADGTQLTREFDFSVEGDGGEMDMESTEEMSMDDMDMESTEEMEMDMTDPDATQEADGS